MEDVISIYKNEEAKRRCMALYDEALKHWPIRFEEINLRTEYGVTHIIACGREEASPLILLHGQWASATMWSTMVEELSIDHRVYAIDQIDDIGKSILTRKIINRSDYGDWLLEVIIKLGINRASIIGLSYGGFLAVNIAIHAPEKVKSLCLLCPGIPLFGSPTKDWALHGMPMIIIPTRKTAEWLVSGMSVNGYEKGNTEHEQLIVGGLSVKSRIPMRPDIQTEELETLKMPILLIIGENETMYEPHTAIARAQRFFPNIETALIPNAGHMLNTDQSDQVIKRIMEFIK